jgi:hypothetical protein
VRTHEYEYARAANDEHIHTHTYTRTNATDDAPTLVLLAHLDHFKVLLEVVPVHIPKVTHAAEIVQLVGEAPSTP